MNQPPPEECANCGAPISRHARACPVCGADERTGWRDVSPEDGLDLPEVYDDEARAARASVPPRREVNGLVWHWWVVGLGLLALLAAALLRGRW